MAGKQLDLSDGELATVQKRTRRETFPAKIEEEVVVVVPWQELIDLIGPYCPKASKKGGRPPYPLATVLRIHLLLRWHSPSDPAMEGALIKVPSMHRFASIDLIGDRIADETR